MSKFSFLLLSIIWFVDTFIIWYVHTHGTKCNERTKSHWFEQSGRERHSPNQVKGSLIRSIFKSKKLDSIQRIFSDILLPITFIIR